MQFRKDENKKSGRDWPDNLFHPVCESPHKKSVSWLSAKWISVKWGGTFGSYLEFLDKKAAFNHEDTHIQVDDLLKRSTFRLLLSFEPAEELISLDNLSKHKLD